MKYISSLAAFTAAVSALGIQDSDVPAACSTICRPLVNLSNLCTSNGETNDNCICQNTSFDVKNLGSMCAICIQQTNKQTDDLKSISSACGFTQGAYNQISASSVAATVIVTATRPGSNSVVTTKNTATGSTSTATAASRSSSGMAVPTNARAAWGVAGAALGVAGMVL